MAQASATPDEGDWMPIESNPDVMSDYIEKLGWPAKQWRFYDVLSTEAWALEMVPTPALAVLLLFPIKPVTEQYAAEENERQKGAERDPSIWFTLQKIGNACGTIGVVHACLNVSTLCGGTVQLEPSSWLAKFYNRTASLTPEERAKTMEQDTELESAHAAQVQEGQSAPIDDTWNHFVAFVPGKDCCLYELDGRRPFPINHGPLQKGQAGSALEGQADVLLSSVEVVQRVYMERDPDEVRFTMVALAPAEGQVE